MSEDDRLLESVSKALGEFTGSLERVFDSMSLLGRTAKEGLESLGTVTEGLDNLSKSSGNALSNAESLASVTASLTKDVEGMSRVWEELDRNGAEAVSKLTSGESYDHALAAQTRYQQAYLDNEAAFLEAGLAMKRTATEQELSIDSAKWTGFVDNAGKATDTLGDILDDLYRTSGEKYRSMFEVMKAFSVAETIIQTYRAAQGAYAALAKIHPLLGVAAAAAATAAGMARVNLIRQTSPEGGGSVSGVSSGGGPLGSYPSPLAEDTKGEQLAQTVTVQIFNPLSEQNWQRIVEEDIIPALNSAADRNIEMKVNIMD